MKSALNSTLSLLCALTALGTTATVNTARAEGIGDFIDTVFNVGSLSAISASNMAHNLDVLNARPQHSLAGDRGWIAANPAEYQACEKQYESMLRDGVLEISLTIGYLDQTKRIIDQDVFEMVYGALTRDCPDSNDTTCGFAEQERVFDSRVILEREFNREVSPRIPSVHKVRVSLTYSSATTRDSNNVSAKGLSADQEEFSRIAEQSFFASIGERGHSEIATCDVCGYIGHARNGAGPDFRPVPLAWRLKNGETNYEKYAVKRANFRRLMSAIATSTHPSRQLVVIMGCSSYSNFWKTKKVCPVEGPGCKPMSLEDYGGKTGFLLTSRLSWPTNQSKYVAMLVDGIMNLKCRSAWNSNYAELNNLGKESEFYRLYGNFLR